jgi:hypothetical protein
MFAAREYKDSDAAAVFNLFSEMYSEFSDNLCKPNYKKAMEALRSCVVWVSVDEQDRPVGILAVRKGTLWYSDEEIIADLVFYIKPTHRKGRRAIDLIECAKFYAKFLKLPIYMGTTSGYDPDGLIKLYEHAGFTAIGNRFLHKAT